MHSVLHVEVMQNISVDLLSVLLLRANGLSYEDLITPTHGSEPVFEEHDSMNMLRYLTQEFAKLCENCGTRSTISECLRLV
jgi:hypothetical protein